MAVFLAASLVLASMFSLPESPYDNAAVEDPASGVVEVTPAESPETALKIDPHAYLYASYPRYARRLDCVYARESRWDPMAYNRRSGAEGLAQMLMTTWVTTPQGKAGAARIDPFASIDASIFLIENTPQSWRHWVAVTAGMC